MLVAQSGAARKVAEEAALVASADTKKHTNAAENEPVTASAT